MMFTAALGFVTGNWQRLVIYGLLILGALGTAAGWGYHRGVLKLYEYQADQAKAAVAVVVKQGAVTERVVNHYIKVQGKTRIVTQTVEKEVIRYVDAKLDNFDLSNGAVSLLDSAAANSIPDARLTTDGTASGLKVAQAVPVVASNYAICNETADRLRGLQEWVTEQKKANP